MCSMGALEEKQKEEPEKVQVKGADGSGGVGDVGHVGCEKDKPTEEGRGTEKPTEGCRDTRNK